MRAAVDACWVSAAPGAAKIRDGLLHARWPATFPSGQGSDLAGVELGVSPDRIDTIANFGAVARHGVKAEGNAADASAGTLAQLAGLIAMGQLDVPIAATFPLDDVREAYRLLAGGHVRGKIVLIR